MALRLSAGQNPSPADLVDRVDLLRLDAARRADPARKATLGQYFTPSSIARLMASMPAYAAPTVTLLDAGAGVGSLFAAGVEALCRRPCPPQRIQVNATDLRGLRYPSPSQLEQLGRTVATGLPIQEELDRRQTRERVTFCPDLHHGCYNSVRACVRKEELIHVRTAGRSP